MMFDKKSTKKDFWREVFKVFCIILVVVAAALCLAVGVGVIIKLLGIWSLIPFVILMVFGGSTFAVYLDWRDR